METMESLIRSPDWWFSAVLVGLGVNLASAYFRDWMDDAVDRRRRRAETKRLGLQKYIAHEAARAIGNHAILTAYAHESIRLQVTYVSLLLLGLAPIVSSVVLSTSDPTLAAGTLLGGVIGWVGAFRCYHAGRTSALIVRVALRSLTDGLGKGEPPSPAEGHGKDQPAKG